MKGKQNVLSEVNLIMICYNLTRLTSILDPKELKNKLKTLGLEPSRLFGAISAILGDFLFWDNFLYRQENGRKTPCTFM
tara:strand:+ start:191275 stop:191511 length:237 start_codon:yes stop_codon:yes gene_type:complete